MNKGSAALFVEGEDKAYMINVSKFEGRCIEQAQNELVVKSPKESFNKSAANNISLIRKKIRNESLMVESSTISLRSNNELYILYVKVLVNEELLYDVKDRVNTLEVDSIQNLSLLEEFGRQSELPDFENVRD